MAKEVSCGVLVTDGTHLLICHPTNSRYWDLPKGKREENESLAEAAAREMEEETGIKVEPSTLDTVGLFNYRPKKSLALFWLLVDKMPDPTKLVCNSTFNKDGREIKEMDAYRVLPIKEAMGKLPPSMFRILMTVFTEK